MAEPTADAPPVPPLTPLRVVVGVVTLLAALPLAWSAVVIVRQSIDAFSELRAARDWKPVPATIEAVSLAETRTLFGPRRAPEVRYSYAFGGARHFGDRVAVEQPSDDPFQLERHADLVRHRDTRTTFTAYVDPAAPTRALLYRQPTERVFIAPFQALGLAALAVVLFRFSYRAFRPRPRRRAPGGAAEKPSDSDGLELEDT